MAHELTPFTTSSKVLPPIHSFPFTIPISPPTHLLLSLFCPRLVALLFLVSPLHLALHVIIRTTTISISKYLPTIPQRRPPLPTLLVLYIPHLIPHNIIPLVVGKGFGVKVVLVHEIKGRDGRRVDFVGFFLAVVGVILSPVVGCVVGVVGMLLVGRGSGAESAVFVDGCFVNGGLVGGILVNRMLVDGLIVDGILPNDLFVDEVLADGDLVGGGGASERRRCDEIFLVRIFLDSGKGRVGNRLRDGRNRGARQAAMLGFVSHGSQHPLLPGFGVCC